MSLHPAKKSKILALLASIGLLLIQAVAITVNSRPLFK